jgi:pyridoxal phosphate enzyme (YggS family)
VPSINEHIGQIRSTLPETVTLVCVSKFHPAEAILEAYKAGERDFGESRVQELRAKYEVLPKDIRWHFIGHLQTNKVRQIVPFVHLIQSVDSVRLLDTIEAEAAKINRIVKVLLEVHVAQEETKSGFSIEEIADLQPLIDLNHAAPLLREYPGLNICGIMGMASNTDDRDQVLREFKMLATIHRNLFPHGGVLSMGMSHDYELALQEGSNMVRIGSSIFGERNY